MAKNKKTFLILLLIIIIGIIFRVYLSTLINKGDVLVQLEWSKVLYQQKLSNSYFYPIWTYSPPTQPPLMMLGFWLSEHIYANRYLLAKMHNVIKIPPSFFILWFDKFGQVILIRLWEIFGDIITAIFIYKIVYLFFKKKWISILAFLIVIFNPITIFETGIWGQNDLISIIFIYISFFLLNQSSYSYVISPLLFILGLLIKPVGLILLPFYIFYYIFLLLKLRNLKQTIILPIISLIFSSLLIYLAFVPFLPSKNFSFYNISEIILKRISPQSKGSSRASNSAFNIYSLIFDIDKTPGSLKILDFNLDNISIFFFLLFNIIFIIYFYKNWNILKKRQLSLLSFTLFVISQGSYLFMTGMLERYFFPGFIASILLLHFSFSNIGWNIIFQHFLWFVNLFYAFFIREWGIIRPLFWNNNFLLTRILSFLVLINFFLIIFKYIFNKHKNNY